MASEMVDEIGFGSWLQEAAYNPRTISVYLSTLRKVASFPIPFHALLDSKAAPNTLHLRYAVLNTYAKWKKDQQLLDQLAQFRRRIPSARRVKPRPPMTHAELERVMQALDWEKPVDLVIMLMALRGFRVGDVLRLQRDQIKEALETGTLAYVAKKGQRQEWGTGLFVEPLETLFHIGDRGEEPWESVADIIARGDDRHQAARWQVEYRCRQLGKELKMNIYPHRLRRTRATFYLEAVNGDVTKLTKWMGWQNVTTAYGYVDHADRDDLEGFEKKMKVAAEKTFESLDLWARIEEAPPEVQKQIEALLAKSKKR